MSIVGRTVQYTCRLQDPPLILAGIITGENPDGTVSLRIFERNKQANMHNVEFTLEPAGSDRARGKWTWIYGNERNGSTHRADGGRDPEGAA